MTDEQETNHAGATATSSTFNETLTIEKLMAAKKAINDLGPNPLHRIKEWMEYRGFAPEDGGVLVLSMHDYLLCGFGDGCFRSPDFIRSSKLISDPMLINPRKALS